MDSDSKLAGTRASARTGVTSNITSNATSADLASLPDEQLMALLQSGCHEAMTPLFRRYRRLLVNISCNILHDRDEAEEVIQEVFFEIYRKIDRFDPKRGSTKAWFVQCAYARSIDRREFLNYRQFCNKQEIPRVLPDATALLGYSDISRETRYEAQSRLVRLALEQLPEKQKLTVEMACFQGLLLREIAARLSDSYDNTRNHYYRGLKKLQDIVKQMLAHRETPATDERKAALGWD